MHTVPESFFNDETSQRRFLALLNNPYPMDRDMLPGLRQFEHITDIVHYLLQCEDPDLYERGVGWAGGLQMEGAFEMLVPVLDDPRPRIRNTAARALAGLADDRAIDPLLARFSDPSTASGFKDTLIWALGALQAEAAVPALLQLLTQGAASTQSFAARAIGKIGGSAVPQLLAILKNADERLKPSVLEALEQLNFHHGTATGIASDVIPDLASPDPLVRAETATLLGQIGDQQAVSGLVLALQDSQPAVRAAAATALGQLKKTLQPLLGALQDESPDVRTAVADALGQLGDTRAVRVLLPLLADHASGAEGQRLPVGVAVALALGRLGVRHSVPALLQATHDPDVDVRWAAITALGEIGDPRALARLEAVIASAEGEEESWADESLADAAQQAIDQISADQ